ncbi:MAG: SPFH domain-containing protein [Anaerolineae bacterium]
MAEICKQDANEGEGTGVSLKGIAASVERELAPQREEREYPEFTFNGLATPPEEVDRSLLSFFGQLTALPGTCVVLTGRGGFQKVYHPGTYSIFDVPLGRAVVQVVNMASQTREIPTVTALSADKWNVTLKAAVDFRVCDPVKIAESLNPLETLDTVATSCVLAQIESMSHDALTGRPDEGAGVDEVAGQIRERLRGKPSLRGLEMINVTIAQRKGDERRIKIVQDATVEETRIVEESMLQQQRDEARIADLVAQKKIARRAQEVALVEAETARRRMEEEERLKIAQAELEAEAAEIRRPQEEWQTELKRQEEEWRTAKELEILHTKSQHEERLEAIKGIAQTTAEAAKSGTLGGLGVSPRRRPETLISEAEPVVEQGIQALQSFQDRVSTRTYLPTRLDYQDPYQRLRLEEQKLAKIKGAEFEVILRSGRIAAATVNYRGYKLKIECPPEYPEGAPSATIVGSEGEEKPFEFAWDESCYLSDLVREALLQLAVGTTVDEGQ